VELNSTLLEPDLVIFLDLSPEEALRRKPGIAEEAERYGSPEVFFGKVREKYLDMLGENWIRLDAEKSKQEVLREALECLSQR
jgi:thymidylate kinase